MNVHLTRIYTRTGDSGTTALSDFSKVRKTDPRLDAYSTCEEANALIGVALLHPMDDGLKKALLTIQNELFDAGADLSTPVAPNPEYPPLRIEQEYIDRLESLCDEYNADLPTLDSFILPGGSPAAAHLHHARTVVRRAERAAWAAIEAFPDTTNKLAAQYLNRLSDFLFIAARYANDEEIKWVPGGQR